MGTGLARLREEDPSFVVRQDTETKQTLLGTQGEMQLGVIISKLKERFNVDVITSPRKIAYRETIKGHSDVQGKHKNSRAVRDSTAMYISDSHLLTIKCSTSPSSYSADRSRKIMFRRWKKESWNVWKRDLLRVIR